MPEPNFNRVPLGWKSGRLIEVVSVPNGLACGCVCPACEGLLVAVNNEGIKVRLHFRHWKPTGGCEGYIHEAAKLGLAQLLADALAGGEEVELKGRFHKCSHPFWTKDILRGVTGITVERRLVEPNIQPDIVLEGTKGPAKTIEIVDKHPPEPAVIEFAKQRQISLAIVEVHTEDELTALLAGFPIVGASAIVPMPCPTCARQQEQKKIVSELVAQSIRPTTTNAGLANPEADRFGSPLKQSTRRTIVANGRKLQALGFRQQAKRATLFLAEIPGWRIYADLDSTTVMRIWETQCVPAMYASAKGRGPITCRECILEAVQTRLEAFNVQYRRHFEDREGHTCHQP